ncbi:MAG: aspartate 1-decarboxylase [Legionellales bacterium]|nr:aspartate 1-decarboxylase [Legionellales bacterium]
MQLTMCRSKIHRATVTDANLNYVGSITIDKILLQEANLREFEQVHIVNNNNGARFVTYIIEGEPGSGTICLNGAASRLAQPGDIIIIIGYGIFDEAELNHFQPKIVYVDPANRLIREDQALKLVKNTAFE